MHQTNPSLIYMAPNRENHVGSYSKSKPPTLPRATSTIQRTRSDISIEVLTKELAAIAIHDEEDDEKPLPPISEVQDAKCECCGMSEECTAEYISRVRSQFSGKLICGICAEAVNGEMDKNGGKKEEAVNEHMSACVRFNRFERANPVLYQAEAIKEILKKSNSTRSKSMNYKSSSGIVQKNSNGLARSSSCIPAISAKQVRGPYNASKPSD